MEALVQAIIVFAAKEYRVAIRKKDAQTIREVESFFRSDWFAYLTDLSPEYLIKKLRMKALSDNT